MLKGLERFNKKMLSYDKYLQKAKYKTAQKSVTFLCNNDEHAEKFGKKVSLTTVSKNKTECLEPKLRRRKPFTIKTERQQRKKWKETLFHDRINVEKMAIISNIQTQCNLHENSLTFFIKLGKKC